MRTAFLFPGQGSQKVGMGRELYEALPAARAVFEEADEALGLRISSLCFDGPEAELARTEHTQPAILAVSIAALRAVEELSGITPDAVAGHSLGEYSALVCAGSLAFADAVRLVRLRGRFMQEAVPAGVGAMAAIIGLEPRTVEDTCLEARGGDADPDGVCAAANENGAGQVVIAGHRALVERAMDLAKRKGAKLVKELPVSAPFHCSLMAPAAARLAEELAKIEVRAPRLPVIGNVEAAPHGDAEGVRDLLVRQVTSTVRWEASVRWMAREGAERIERTIEIGPGRVLSGLVRRIAPGIKLHSVETTTEARALAAVPA